MGWGLKPNYIDCTSKLTSSSGYNTPPSVLQMWLDIELEAELTSMQLCIRYVVLCERLTNKKGL